MRDVAKLLRRLELLVGVTALGVACAKSDAVPDIEPEKPKKTALVTKASNDEPPPPAPSPTTTTSTPPKPTSLRPTGGGGCPPIDWCAPAATTKPLAKAGSATKLGCAVALESKGSAPPGTPWFAYGDLDEASTKRARADAGKTDTCCYTLRRLCGGGRAFSDGDVAHVAEVREGTAWHASLAALRPVPEELRLLLASAWLRDARIEHASVASFARVALELVVVGAPPDLVADAHRAALDEIRHAEICFAIASSYLGRDVSPGPLALPSPRPCTLDDVARSALVEGCIGETIAALVATRAATACDDPSIREALEVMAEDETAHAALAHRIVRWCVGAGARRDALRDAIFVPDPESAPEGLEAHGRLGRRALADVARDAVELVVRPLMAAIA